MRLPGADCRGLSQVPDATPSCRSLFAGGKLIVSMFDVVRPGRRISRAGVTRRLKPISKHPNPFNRGRAPIPKRPDSHKV